MGGWAARAVGREALQALHRGTDSRAPPPAGTAAAPTHLVPARVAPPPHHLVLEKKQGRLQANLVGGPHMNDHHQVPRSNQPHGRGEGRHDGAGHLVAKGGIPRARHRNVDGGHDAYCGGRAGQDCGWPDGGRHGARGAVKGGAGEGSPPRSAAAAGGAQQQQMERASVQGASVCLAQARLPAAAHRRRGWHGACWPPGPAYCRS